MLEFEHSLYGPGKGARDVGSLWTRAWRFGWRTDEVKDVEDVDREQDEDEKDDGEDEENEDDA